MNQTQTTRLREYLIYKGSIQPLEAWTELGIYRLSARINDLKKQGYEITSGRTEVRNRYGEKLNVAEYKLTL